MTQPYNPKKAETFNKLRQQGLSEDAAADQAGITDADFGTYAIGDNGQMGALIVGSGKVAGVDFDRPTAAESAGFENVSYPQKASAPPSSVTPINYNTTSTETVSGGGTTAIIAGAPRSNANSEAAAVVKAEKQAEVDQFIKDNPSNLARKRQGLPPLTPEENEARETRRRELEDEVSRASNNENNAKTPGVPTIINTPNTTTTTRTVTAGTSSTDQAVDPFDDEKLSQENEAQLDATPSLANASTAREAAPVSAIEQGGEGPAQRLPQPAPPQDFVTEEDGTLIPSDSARAEERRAEIAAEEARGRTDAPAPVAGSAIEQGGEQEAQDALAARNAAPEPVPPNVTVIQDENGSWGVWNDDEGRFIVEGLSQQEAQLQADEIAAGFGVQERPFPPGALNTGPAPVPDTKYDEFGNVVPNTPEAIAAAEAKAAEQRAAEEQAAAKLAAINQATLQSVYKAVGSSDWRVRLQLAPSSDYLYNANPPGILGPLAPTNGVIFPYTPQINTSYKANYEQYDLVHSNYRGVYYKNSRVDDLSIRGVFTAQDTREADYLLAVIHFFRSVTKMFYGKDEQRGSPPPLVYLSGLGMNQFFGHPCVVSSFQYNLPDQVDYIRATSVNNYGTDLLSRRTPGKASGAAGLGATGNRILNAGLERFFPAAKPAPDPVVGSVNNTQLANYVPTKMEIDITLIPVQTRSQVSKQFSLKGFANGDLIKGGFW
jgi:hypothetical protein